MKDTKIFLCKRVLRRGTGIGLDVVTGTVAVFAWHVPRRSGYGRVMRTSISALVGMFSFMESGESIHEYERVFVRVLVFADARCDVDPAVASFSVVFVDEEIESETVLQV